MSYAVSGEQNESPARPGARSLIAFLAGSATLAVLGALTTSPAVSTWFINGPRAPWTPQTELFVTIWTVVYLADGIAGWLLWRRVRVRDGAGSALAIYAVQGALQLLWLIAFAAQVLVNGSLLWLVFTIILLLDLILAAGVFAAWRVSRAASVILLVVLIWLLFGTVLSWSDTILRELSLS